MDILAYEFQAILLYGIIVLSFVMYLDYKKEKEQKKHEQEDK
jgi:hypothetical protein